MTPRLAALLAEIYGDQQQWLTPTTTRTHLPHLQGFDPQSAPTYIGFPELEEIRQQLDNPRSNGNGAWVNLPLHDPAQLPNLIRPDVPKTVTKIYFVNFFVNDVLLYIVNANGTERYYSRVRSGSNGGILSIGANELLLIKENSGKNLAVFQGEEKVGRALIPVDIASPFPQVLLKDVSIPDANLRAAIEAVIGEDGVMGHLTRLDAENTGITDLTGLEHAIYLAELDLSDNPVSDISPLAGLTNLMWLSLINNRSIRPLDF